MKGSGCIRPRHIWKFITSLDKTGGKKHGVKRKFANWSTKTAVATFEDYIIARCREIPKTVAARRRRSDDVEVSSILINI